jgi:hypothetical protein
VQALLEARDGGFGRDVVGQAHEQDVELLAVEQLVEARVDGGADPRSCGLGPRGVEIADRDDGRAEAGEHVDVILRDPAGADDRDTERVAHGIALPRGVPLEPPPRDVEAPHEADAWLGERVLDEPP